MKKLTTLLMPLLLLIIVIPGFNFVKAVVSENILFEDINSITEVDVSTIVAKISGDVLDGGFVKENTSFKLDGSKSIPLHDSISADIYRKMFYLWSSSCKQVELVKQDGTIAEFSVGSVDVDTKCSISLVLTNLIDTSKPGTINFTIKNTIELPIDTTAPVITILGYNPKSVYQHHQYIDAGATATDAVDGNLTTSIIGASTVNTSLLGAYTVTYVVSDMAHNTATSIRIVNVISQPVDISAIVIKISGDVADGGFTKESINFKLDGSKSIPLHDSISADIYRKLFYVWSSSCKQVELVKQDGTIAEFSVGSVDVDTKCSISLVLTNLIDTSKPGTINFTIKNTIELPIDTTAPVITILGDNPKSVYQHHQYIDAGATATDTIDGSLTTSIVTTNTVNTSLLGAYTVTYVVSDIAHNTATSTRIVNVINQPTGGGGGGGSFTPPTHPLPTPVQVLGEKITAEDGRWVKTQDRSTVYFVDKYNVRHAYPNGAIWNSYFGSDFSFVEIITKEELASYPLGKNVLYKLGSLMKIKSVPKVYRVGDDGQIQWIISETVARRMYGNSWGTLVDDLNEAFFMDYIRVNDLK